jgi:hypothetical protein
MLLIASIVSYMLYDKMDTPEFEALKDIRCEK